MKLIHYAAKELKKVHSEAQHPDDMRGPMGKPFGFWVSVEDDPTEGWKAWCEGESFRLSGLAYEHKVTLREGANILYIRNQAELLALTAEYKKTNKWGSPDFIYNLDWVAVAKKWQGIIITPYIWEQRLEIGTQWYYGWDCASGCIWDANAIKSVSLVRINKKYKGLVEKTHEERMADLKSAMDAVAPDIAKVLGKSPEQLREDIFG